MNLKSSVGDPVRHRRAVLSSLLCTVYAALLSKPHIAGAAGAAAAAPDARAAPAFYVGSHQHGRPDNGDRFGDGSFPRSLNSMEPYDYGPIRSHNVEALNATDHNHWWTGRQSQRNRYDWERLDRWVDKVTSRAHPIVLNLFGVPAFAARLRDYRDVYGMVGGTSGPDDMLAWQEFVRDTTARIIDRKGAANLIAVEAWNEPIGDDVNGNGKFLVSRGYAPGHRDSHAALLADITKHTFLGVRSVPAARQVPVLYGAQAYLDGKSLDRLMNAQTTSGEPALRFCDAVSFHPYGVFDGNGVQPGLSALTQTIRQKLERSNAAHLPLWASEVGLNAPWHDRVAKWWRGLDTDRRAVTLYEWIQQYRRLGWRAVITYSAESSDDFLGTPQSNPKVAEAISRAFRELQK